MKSCWSCQIVFILFLSLAESVSIRERSPVLNSRNRRDGKERESLSLYFSDVNSTLLSQKRRIQVNQELFPKLVIIQQQCMSWNHHQITKEL